MKILTLFINLFSSSVGMAQHNPVWAITMWAVGYVVTIRNDTIRGQVRVGSLVNDSPASIIVRIEWPTTKRSR
jgi:hypothetical protein